MRAKYFILLLIFLSACMPQVDNATMENAITPSSTPEIANTVTPLPTATLSEVDKIFVIPTKDSSFTFDSTPMPISTPITTTNILLRNLSEKDYITWIRELQVYSYQNYPPYGDWWSDGEFISSQLPLALVIQEFLYLYPNSIHAERLKWQLAFIDSLVFNYITIVGGNVYNDIWVINELEKEINQGKFLPDEMEVFLDQYWFDVKYYEPVENLFGGNEVSWFYVISPQVWKHEEEYEKNSDYFGYGGLFIVIRKLDNGEYKIYLLENAISFINGASSLFEISDFNQNGTTEIALNIGYHGGGGYCSGHLSIYEWVEDEFNDLTNNEITLRDCGDFYEYSVVSGIPTIVFTKFYQPGLSIYTWNGSYYEFSGYRYSTLVEKWWATDNFSEEAFAIEEILASEDFSGLDNAHVDFLRLRLGILYALESKEVQSKMILQSLVDNSFDKTRTVYSDFARNFLKYHSGDETLYLACKKSREIFDASIPYIFSDEAAEKFGIPFTFSNEFDLNLLKCSDKNVMDTLIKNISPFVDNIPVWLIENGMKIQHYEPQDIDLDGILDEWLIVNENGVYLIVPETENYQIVTVETFWQPESEFDYSNISIDIARWHEVNGTILRVRDGTEFSILSISKEYEIVRLDTQGGVSNVNFSVNDTFAQYQVFYIKPTPNTYYPDYPWRGYRWDALSQEFKPDLFEYTIFVEKNKEESLDISKNLLPILDDWRNVVNQWSGLPRYYYLSALSYEFAGDFQKAAEIYYKLWREFPESHYAGMAKFKLEPINP